MRPASAAISPASWPIRVVLPAPFGTQSEMESEAMTPPKRLVSSSISSSASATARSRQQAVDAAACKQHDQQEQGSEHDLPIFGHANRRIPEHGKRHGPDQDRKSVV